MAQQHVSAFDMDLQTIRARLSEMGGLAEEQLSGALDALRRNDIELAQSVIVADVELDRREVALEELAVRTLALRQPLASDLRETIAALKIASVLERIGDLARNIARRVATLSESEPLRASVGIREIGQLALAQLTDALDAYGARDTDAATEVWRRDVAIDELYNSMFRELIQEMTENPRLIIPGTHLMFIAKNLERVGDHTTFISEMTYYIVIGQSLTSDRPKGDPMFVVDVDVDALVGRASSREN